MGVRIAIPNIFGQESKRLKSFALKEGFSSIDWSLDLNTSEEDFFSFMEELSDFEVRFHARFEGVDLAYKDFRANICLETYQQYIDMISRCGSTCLTIHLGLGGHLHDELSLDRACHNLCQLNNYALSKGVNLCLENLAKGWTSDPDTFKEIIKKTGVNITFDIGHARTATSPLKNPFKSCREYVEGCEEKMLNAHVYDYEAPEKGHICPERDLRELEPRLNLLLLAQCEYWVIELFTPEEILALRDLLICYLESKNRLYLSSSAY